MKSAYFRVSLSILATGAAFISSAAPAQVAVVDVSAIKQQTTTALQSVAAVTKQIQQYELQVQQYQNAVQNTLAPVTNVYRQATADVTSAQTSMDGVTKIVPTNTSLSSYLAQFTNGTGVSASTNLCASQGLCSTAQLSAATSRLRQFARPRAAHAKSKRHASSWPDRASDHVHA